MPTSTAVARNAIAKGHSDSWTCVCVYDGEYKN